MESDSDYYDATSENGDDYDDDDDNDYFDKEVDEEYNNVEDEYDDGFGAAIVRNGPSFKVITKECLLAAQKEDMQNVMELLSLKQHHVRTLLIHYRWDVDKIFQVFVDKGKDWLYKEACVMVQDDDHISSIQSSSVEFCGICMEEIPLDKMTKMDCNHCFCDDCWTQHFVVKISEGQSRRISCMAEKCKVICDEGIIRDYVSQKDPDLGKKFDRYLLESYIEDNKMVKWCTSIPHCGNAIRVEYDEYCEVECACGVQFCFKCSSEAHSPCSCQMWELWTRKCKDESETVNWMKVNTKNCPKCYKPAEKNGGCNHVRCICGQAFCWLCGGATGYAHTWTSIEGHTCGRFTEDEIADKERAKASMFRFAHYHNRFKAHKDSLKAEMNLKEKLYEQISNLEDQKLEMRDFSWVKNGAERLYTSRHILSNSYSFAYYMFSDFFLTEEMTKEDKKIKQNLFEDEQQQLEGYVEKLSLFLAEPFDKHPEKIIETRMNIINLSKTIDDLIKNLYDCIENEILLPLPTPINIAPYRPKGAYVQDRGD